MAKTIKITTDNQIEVLDIPWTYDMQRKAIEADCTEAVKTRIMFDLFTDQIVMLVDESGRVKNRPINETASLLYGIQYHGQPICGDVIFAKQEGPEIVPLENAELMKFFMLNHFSFLTPKSHEQEISKRRIR